MRQKLVTLVVGLALAGVFALPAASHEGHRSCAGGAPGAVEALGLPIAPGPGFGTGFVEPIATSGAAAETVAVLHAAYCEPAP
jgi:hypothetical protein